MDLRRTLERFITHTITEVVIACLILTSVVLVLLEASMSNTWVGFATLETVNDVITYIFCVELTIRFYAERRKMRFFRRYWIDIIAVLPLLRAFRVLRVLRLLRLFRVGIILSRHLTLFSRTFQYIKLEYVIIVFAIVVSVLMGALSMRFAEGRSNPQFRSFEDTLWFSVMTTVGSEPIGGEPKTALGRMVTLTLMMGGLTVFAVFTGTVSAVMIDSLRNLKFRHMEIEELEDHVVVCGWNRAAELILDEFQAVNSFKHIVVVAEDRVFEEDRHFRTHPHRFFSLRGDYTRIDVLKEAGIERAAAAIILADDSKDERSRQDRDARTVLAAMLIEKLNEEIYTTVQLLNRDNETSLRRVGVEEIIVSDEYVGNIMASVVRNRGIISMLDELLTAKWGHQLFKCSVPEEYIGLSVEEAMVRLKKEDDATLLAVEAHDDGERRMMVNPPAELVLSDDHLIIVAADHSLNGQKS